MINSLNFKNQIYLILLFFILNISLSLQNPLDFEISINTDPSESEGFYIDNNNNDSPCDKWMPSLTIPLLLVPRSKDIDGEGGKIGFFLKNPLLYKNKEFEVTIFEDVAFLKDKYRGTLVRTKLPNLIFSCYFGLSPGINNYGLLSTDSINLYKLEKDGNINHKIFSFDKWNIKSTPIKSTFYLGESHNNFNLKRGIIGTCKNYPEDSLWGCSFKEMIFNNIVIPLKNKNGSLYKIYFSSENHNLIFPLTYKEVFQTISNNVCESTLEGFLSCKDFYNDTTEYVNLKLTEESDNMVIFGQVDNVNRFNSKDENKKDYARIKFEDIDYIILPLMVFKEFLIQFDAENKLISFYTEDNKILQVKEKINNDNSSYGFMIFLVILIILLILCLGFGVYKFIKSRSNVEKDINKFNKFEEEENFHNMNENRVF